MDRMLYVAMSGAKETMLAQATNSNNLANAGASGFLADLQQFRSMPVYGDGFRAALSAFREASGGNLGNLLARVRETGELPSA